MKQKDRKKLIMVHNSVVTIIGLFTCSVGFRILLKILSLEPLNESILLSTRLFAMLGMLIILVLAFGIVVLGLCLISIYWITYKKIEGKK